MSKLLDVCEQSSVTQTYFRQGVGAEPPPAGGYGVLGAKPQPLSDFLKVFEKKAILTEVESRTHRSRPRTQKKSEAEAKDQTFEDKPSQGQAQKWSRPRTEDTIFLNYCMQIFRNFETRKCLRYCISLSF